MAAPTEFKLPRYGPDPEGTHPPLGFTGYRSTALRHPQQAAACCCRSMLTEVTGPLLGPGRLGEHDNDLTRQHAGEPQGQRIIVTGRLLDGDGRPVRDSLVEIWQANARRPLPAHRRPLAVAARPELQRRRPHPDRQRRPLHLHHHQARRVPVENHDNAWRPAHIHFSVFGRAFTQRLVTQMYFPDDPLFSQDPIFNSIPDEKARQRMVSRYDHEITQAEWALGVPVRHRAARARRVGVRRGRGRGRMTKLLPTPSQTVGPYLSIGLPWPDGPTSCPRAPPARSGSAAPSATAPATRSRTP